MAAQNGSGIDEKTLIGTVIASEYLFQQEQQSLKEALIDLPGDNENSRDQRSLESLAWSGAIVINGVLIKKACEHPSCNHFCCDRNLRIDGIEI